jgi:hypothetical protein
MKKKLTGYIVRCDSCGRLDEIADDAMLPRGWNQVKVPNGEGRLPSALADGTFEVCSLRCLRRWAADRATAIAEPLPSERPQYVKTPCPTCGRLIAPQGIRKHVEKHDGDVQATIDLYYERRKDGEVPKAEVPGAAHTPEFS